MGSLRGLELVREFQALSDRLEVEGLLGELNRLREDLDLQIRLDESVLLSAIGLATGLSVGYVLWLTQGGLLLASLISSMPAWRLIDPLPILAGRRARHESDEDDSLDSLIQESSAGERPPPGEETDRGDSPAVDPSEELQDSSPSNGGAD
jgi:hypothetical protein